MSDKKSHRSKKPQSMRKDNAVIPVDKIEAAAVSVRDEHPKVTDRQHELVVALLHDGCTITEAAKRIDANRSWATTTLNKKHILEYMHQLAINAVGAHALRAVATMDTLLTAKSEKVRQEAAADLMNRAGIGTDNATNQAPPISINISI